MRLNYIQQALTELELYRQSTNVTFANALTLFHDDDNMLVSLITHLGPNLFHISDRMGQLMVSNEFMVGIG